MTDKLVVWNLDSNARSSAHDVARGIVHFARERGLQASAQPYSIMASGIKTWGTSYALRCDCETLQDVTRQAVAYCKAQWWREGYAPNWEPETLDQWQALFRRWAARQWAQASEASALLALLPYRASMALDFDDVTTRALWLEFINEFPERRKAWATSRACSVTV